MMTIQEIEVVNDYDSVEIIITDMDGKEHSFMLSNNAKSIIITEKDLTGTK